MTEQEFALRGPGPAESALPHSLPLPGRGARCGGRGGRGGCTAPSGTAGSCGQPEFFETWLTRILINVCKDELRRRRRECRICVPPEPEAEHMDALSLREAVRALPEELRSVIVLRYFTGLTLEETAAALEIPRGTVSSRQRRALELLRLDLTDGQEVGS